MNKYDVQEIIGEGTYGVVVKALNKETNEIVAIKKFKDNGRNFIKRELKMLNTLKSSEFIINLKEAFRRNEKIYFIFEYVERTVLQLLFDYPNGISQNICKSLTFQLCKAIEKCHSMNIIHRDVKPENLLIDRNYHLKLCDFGFARTAFCEEQEVFTEYVATRWYRAPELLLVCPYGKSVDIWAIGCMVCEMTSGRPIYEGKSDLDQLQKIKSSLGPVAEYQLDELQRSGKQPNVRIVKDETRDFSLDRKFANKMNDKLLDFTKKCFTINPKDRPDITQCLEHPALEIQHRVYINKLQSTTRPANPNNNLKFKEIQTLQQNRNLRNNFSTFSMGDTNSRCVISRTDSNNELKPRYLANRPKLNLQPPASTSITNPTEEPVTYNFKAMNFPSLAAVENYNSNIMNQSKNVMAKSEQHIPNDKQDPANIETRKPQINRSLTQISHYGNTRSYKNELKNKEERTSNFIRLLKSKADAKKRSKSTFDAYKNNIEATVARQASINSSMNIHNNQDLTVKYSNAHNVLQNSSTLNKFQKKIAPDITYRFESTNKNIKVNANQYLVDTGSKSRSGFIDSSNAKYSMMKISNMRKSVSTMRPTSYTRFTY